MSQSAGLVSVVIPIYNVEAYLARCLESVAGQSYQEIEILCVNDGSTDASGEIARQFALREPRCRVIEQSNAGLSAARNTGVAEAKGRWVFFLDSDDWMPPHALQVLVRAVNQTNLAVVSGAVMEYWEEGGIYKPYIKPKRRLNGLLHLHRQNFFALEPMVWNKLYPREWVKEYAFAPGLVHEDLDFYWRFFSAYPEVFVVPDVVVYYRRRSGSLSQQKTYDERYQDHYIHIVDNAFRAASAHKSLRYHARRQSLKYLQYLKEKSAPHVRYAEHIERQYGVWNSAVYHALIKLKNGFGF